MTRAAALVLVAGLVACGSPPPAADASSAPAASATATSSEPAEPAPAAAPAEGEPADEAKDGAAPKKSQGSAKAGAVRIGARHVLIQWMGSQRAASSVVRTREQAHSLALEVLSRARQGEDFARLAVEFSDEPGAAGRGGSLGNFTRGKMVPQFDAAAFALEAGQISDIVETPFGFHIIQRTE
ncbi:MAG: peptidyl-prolyl cis-trans isomerase [Myxococcales bacterium]|nr:peptidyl-prolyl cis-trans isomerase [Myxococcales bacterium]